MAEDSKIDITALTVQLVSAFVSNNQVSSEGLADLIRTTRAALTEDPAAPAAPAAPDHVPAVSIRKSLSSPDHILSLIDGRPYKTLKRHLAVHGLTEKEYRERYNLPGSYPLVAPSYSQARRAVAERSGLGRKPVSKASPVKESPRNNETRKSTPAQTAGKAKGTAAKPRSGAKTKSLKAALEAASTHLNADQKRPE